MVAIDKRIYDADQARLVLENEAFAAAFADMKAEITQQWESSPVRDAEGREELFKLLKLANKLELILRSSMDDGKLAKHEINQKQNWADRAKQAIGL
ncbi:MAG: hypothetical protein V4633_13490 [Pseudomonadota bacterium]